MLSNFWRSISLLCKLVPCLEWRRIPTSSFQQRQHADYVTLSSAGDPGRPPSSWQSHSTRWLTLPPAVFAEKLCTGHFGVAHLFLMSVSERWSNFKSSQSALSLLAFSSDSFRDFRTCCMWLLGSMIPFVFWHSSFINHKQIKMA